jgi:hypothetical protein
MPSSSLCFSDTDEEMLFAPNRRLLAKAFPEPDLKYRSRLRAVASSATDIHAQPEVGGKGESRPRGLGRSAFGLRLEPSQPDPSTRREATAPWTLRVLSPDELDRERTLSRHLKVQTRVIPINYVVEPFGIVPLFGDQPSQRWNVLRVAGNPISLARIPMLKFPDPVRHMGVGLSSDLLT